MFTFKQGDIKVPENNEKYILFGIRPCDAKAIALLDKNFDTKDFPDPYYIDRRKNSILIAEACIEPESTCFCTAFGSGPFESKDADALIIDRGDYYLIDGNEKALSLFDGLLEDDGGEKILELKKKAEDSIKSPVVEGIDKKLSSMIDDPIWDEVSRKCITCGACTYLCPTCYCFDIQDVGKDDKYMRERVWDSCMFTVYTLEASGHNPRKEKEKRMRQRVMHKFNYYPFLYDEYGCVGCGRCIKYCPVNVDIRKIITKIMEV